MDAAWVHSGFITTREYYATQGVALNSDFRALKRMAGAGAAVKVGAAKRIGEQTWGSDPARAFVGYSQHILDIDSDEIIQRVLAYSPEDLTTNEVAAVSEEMGWRSSLHRIASIAISVAKNGSTLSVLASELANTALPANRGDRWRDLNSKAAKLKRGNIGWTDFRHKVKCHIPTTELSVELPEKYKLPKVYASSDICIGKDL